MSDSYVPTSVAGESHDGYSTDFGNAPKIDQATLEPVNRVVTSVSQGLAVCQALEWDANLLIRNAAKITALKQGSKPYDSARLQSQGKAYKTNVSTGAYGTTLTRVAPRLYIPLKQASTLTAASLPPSIPDADAKQDFFRDRVTAAIRSWPRWNWFITGLAKEVVDYGFSFAAFTDPYEWRPHLVRMDRGFVPRGSEIMDLNLPFFELKWDYKPEELLDIVKRAVGAGVTGWNTDAVAMACQWAKLPSAANVPPTEWRKWEELVREQVWNTTYKKGYRIIEVKHLFVMEASGKVSQYLFWKDGPEGSQLLYVREDAYPSMADVVVPVVFGWGDGTIHGSWGAGHLLYDLGRLVEKLRCDMVDNLRNANKTRLQVNDPKDINDVKQVVNDTEIIISGAQYAQNMGGVSQNVDAYITLNNFMTQFMEQKVGAYIPPINTPNGDVTATQVQANVQKEAEVNNDAIETFLSQMAFVIQAMIRRLCDPSNMDPVAQALQQELLSRMTPEEINALVNQPVVQSVMDFTPAAAQARAMFARSVMGNPLFDQKKLARMVAEGTPGGGSKLAELVVIPDGDNSATMAAQRQQMVESAAMLTGQDIPVLPNDNHWVHMQTLKPQLAQAIQGQMVGPASVALKHYAAHWTAGVSTKTLPPQAINDEKSFIANAEKAIQQLQLSQQMIQAAQQAREIQSGVVQAGTTPGQPGQAPQTGMQ